MLVERLVRRWNYTISRPRSMSFGNGLCAIWRVAGARDRYGGTNSMNGRANTNRPPMTSYVPMTATRFTTPPVSGLAHRRSNAQCLTLAHGAGAKLTRTYHQVQRA